MFAGVAHAAAFRAPASTDGTPRKIPDPTPVIFPQCAPQTEDNLPASSRAHSQLVALLQTIQRPTDIELAHFAALGLHVISDASPQDILPDPSFLPPVEQWASIGPDELERANLASKKPLNNGNLSPGVQTYLEREKELSIGNRAAFRSIRRIPPPPGESAVRLGNAYEFFKNLEFFSGYWIDTSLPPEPEPDPNCPANKDAEQGQPPALQLYKRTGTGSQLPPEFRQHLLTAFIKLVAYDFGCNVSFPRCEPRLNLAPPPPPPSSASPPSPPSYFNSSVTFIYRTPTDRSAARSGVVEGPLAAVSSRTTTGFATEVDERLDLAREVVAVLLTAQQRAREGQVQRKFGEGKWWTTKPRWGGGPGGAIGREGDRLDDVPSLKLGQEKVDAAAPLVASPAMEKINDVKRAIGGINGPILSKKSKKANQGGNMAIYENYRKMLPPGSNWDPKARYIPVGKLPGAAYDDIFMVSALNHHVAIIRVRVPDALLGVLDGGLGEEGWERLCMWRSKWYDLFLAKDRIEAMGLIWGMMAWLMRSTQDPAADASSGSEGKVGGESMDVS